MLLLKEVFNFGDPFSNSRKLLQLVISILNSLTALLGCKDVGKSDTD